MLRDRNARRRMIIFVVLVGLCMAMLIVSGSAPVQELRRGVHFAVAPVQDTLSSGARSVTSVLGAIGEIDVLRRENIELQSSVDRLADEVAALEVERDENKRLKKLLRAKDRAEHATATARITARHTTPYERVVTLDSGAEVGIVEGAPVLSEGGALAGQVSDVGEGWAEVMLITDTRSLVAGLDSRTRATGHVSGRLSANLAMTQIPVTDKISVGDRVVTLGARLGKKFRSAYPSGLPIGRVVDVQRESGAVVQTAFVQPDADLEHLEYALVITDFKPPRGQGNNPPGGSDDS